jgi:hypothetical protein
VDDEVKPGAGTSRRSVALAHLATTMISASAIDSTTAEVVEEIDAIQARATWLAEALRDLVPSRQIRALDTAANLLHQGIRGLSDTELALIAAHGFAGDGAADDDDALALRFQNVTDDHDRVRELVDAVRRLRSRSIAASNSIRRMVDPRALTASKPAVAVRRELLLRLSGAWQDLTRSPFTGYGRSGRFALAFFQGIELPANAKTVENDWKALR